MSMPGWYPDPAGQQGQFRYWNGSDWSTETTVNPQQTPPPGASPYGGGGSGRSGGKGPLIGIVVTVVVLIVAVVLIVNALRGNNGGPAAEDTNTSTPTGSAWDETSTPTPTTDSPTPTESGATQVRCPDGATSTGSPRDGRLYGGGISVAEISGWREGGFSLPWVHGLTAQSKQITTGWISVSSVGALSVADGFEVPEVSARQMVSCFASSYYYTGFTGRKEIIAEPVTVDGKKGFHVAAEIYVDNQGPDIPGDRVDVVVIDTGSPESMGVYISSATIGDKATQSEVDAARTSMKVD